MTNNNFPELDEVEVEVIYSLIEASKEYFQLEQIEKNIKSITTNLKTKIRKLGLDRNQIVHSSINNSEWLFDLVWRDAEFSKLTLVLESELSSRKTEGLLLDFNKLLISNADYRIFICFNKGNQKFPENINRLISLFETSVNKYQNLPINSRVLVLLWDDYKTGYIFPHLIIKQ